MLTSPKQNWKLYEEKCQEEHLQWLRRLTSSEGIELFYALHHLGFNLQDQGCARIDEEHWKEKLAIRKKIVAFLTGLDRIRGERHHSENSA